MRRVVLGWIALAACTSTELEALPPQPAPIARIAAPPPIARPATPDADADPNVTSDVEAHDAESDALVLSHPPSSSACTEAAQMLQEGADAMRDDRADLARDRWIRLVREFPTCPQVPHVYLGLAEHFFAKGELASAKQTYEKAAQFTEPEVRTFALYKLAWCELGLRDGQRALERFVQVVRAAGADPSPTIARLRDTAIRDSVIAFAEVGQPNKAVDFYRTLVGDAPLVPVIDALARTYRDRGDATAVQVVCKSAGTGACVGL